MKKFYEEPSVEKLNLYAEAITSGNPEYDTDAESGHGDIPEA